MAQHNFSSLRKQAHYIEEVISSLDLKLANPASFSRTSKILHAEKILENIVAENEGILVNTFFHIKVKSLLVLNSVEFTWLEPFIMFMLPGCPCWNVRYGGKD